MDGLELEYNCFLLGLCLFSGAVLVYCKILRFFCGFVSKSCDLMAANFGRAPLDWKRIRRRVNFHRDELPDVGLKRMPHEKKNKGWGVLGR